MTRKWLSKLCPPTCRRKLQNKNRRPRPRRRVPTSRRLANGQSKLPRTPRMRIHKQSGPSSGDGLKCSRPFGSWARCRTLIIQSPCKPPCTPDFCKVLAHHGLMKSDLRISVKDYRRTKTLKIQMAQVNFSSSRQFLVRMNGAPWPTNGRPVSITKVLTALRKSLVKSMSP